MKTNLNAPQEASDCMMMPTYQQGVKQSLCILTSVLRDIFSCLKECQIQSFSIGHYSMLIGISNLKSKSAEGVTPLAMKK